MGKTMKKILCILMVVLMCLTSVPVGGLVGLDLSGFDFGTTEASALSSSGSCGSNVTYTYNSSTKALTISGTGEMEDYSYYGGSPFCYSDIKSVVIESGVTSIGYYAFWGCTSLTSVTIPDSVSSIGYGAFEDCTGLTSITIPDSVTSIGGGAFYWCTGLISVTIPDSVTSIGWGAFEDCTGLTSVTIPDSVTSMGERAFSGCTGLTSVTIPDSVTYIGYYAFSGCTSLTSITVDSNNTEYSSDSYGVLFNKDKTELIQYPVGNKRTSYTIPDSVTSIGNSAFSGCTGLASVTIPNSVTSMGERAFSGCINLTSITIPNSITCISDYAFYNCTGLTSVTIPDSVTSIGYSAFFCCTSLTSITIPDSVTSIGNYAFYGCTSLTGITVDSNNTEYSSDSYGVLFNKDKTELIQYPAGNKRTSYTIPDSVTSIGEYAFNGCTSLTSVTIPDSVTSIGENAFYGCTSLTSVTIPDSVTSIGDYAFWGCTRLTSITIPDSVTSIGYYAFKGCTGLTSVTIPDSVTSIGYWAFSGCTSLTGITVDGNNTKYSSDSYGVLFNKGKTELIQYPTGNKRTSYTIPDSVTSIGDYAFRYCNSLTSITVDSNNIKYSSDSYGVLFNKDKTELIRYPIGNKRTSYAIPNSVTSIGDDAFEYCTSLTSITIPDSVTSIGYGMFDGCTSLTSVTIGNGVTSIDDYAFEDCSNLENVTIGSAVTSIGEFAFYDCDNLTDVYYNGTKEDWNAVFIDGSNLSLLSATIHCLDGDLLVTDPNPSDDDDPFVDPEPSYDYIYFGSYPQSEVTDETITAELNKLAPAWDSWINYGYYSGTEDVGSMTQGDWMRYTDVTYNGEKYRGVKFTEYRPYFTINPTSSDTCQDDNGYYTNTVYWFKFESLKWRVLDASTGLIMCETIIDSQPYSNTIYRNSSVFGDTYAYFNDSSYTNYASDYETSSIRAWLNDEFYKTAFTSAEQSTIATSTLNNDGIYTLTGETGYEKLDSNDTNDKIFLLSYDEVLNTNFGFCSYSFISDIARQANGSDYAKCQGLLVYEPKGDYGYDESYHEEYSFWLLRSPGNDSLISCRVYGDGYVDDLNDVNVTVCGIRPALRLNSLPSHTHTPKTITIPATCTVDGMTYQVCSVCGDPIGTPTVITAAHTPGNWKVEIEPTYETEGKEVIKCTVCHEVLDSKPIPKLVKPVITDKNTGIKVEYNDNNYNGKVDMEVTETFDGAAFQIIDTIGATSSKVYDIVLTVDGKETQPNGKVTVKIPLPAGYNPDHSYVYHVNTETGAVEKMPAHYENGFMVFETDHFSYYAVIEIHEHTFSGSLCTTCGYDRANECSCNCHKSGILHFFFVIVNFFQKLFGNNKVCACGKVH